MWPGCKNYHPPVTESKLTSRSESSLGAGSNSNTQKRNPQKRNLEEVKGATSSGQHRKIERLDALIKLNSLSKPDQLIQPCLDQRSKPDQLIQPLMKMLTLPGILIQTLPGLKFYPNMYFWSKLYLDKKASLPCTDIPVTEQLDSGSGWFRLNRDILSLILCFSAIGWSNCLTKTTLDEKLILIYWIAVPKRYKIEKNV